MSALHLHTWIGENKTIPILALHGFTGSGLDFEYFAEHSNHYLSWYSPDLMGHGQTPLSKNIEDYSFSAHMGYLDQIAQEIGKPFILLGYSMGGRLALNYALERPHFIRKLIMVSATPGILDNHERDLRRSTDEALAAKIIEIGVPHFLQFWQDQSIIKSQKNIPDFIYQSMQSRRLQNNTLGLANSLKGMGSGTMHPLWNRLSEIKFPLTMITGEIDNKFSEIAQQIHLILPHAIHEMIPNVGHAAIWEVPERFLSSIQKLNLLNLTIE